MSENGLRSIAGGRALPQNVEAERSVIGAVLLRESMLPEVEDLQAADFFLPAHRAIWMVFQKLAKQEKKLDAMEVGEELRRCGDLLRLEGGDEYLLTCASSVVTLENAGHYANHVREKSSMRALIQVLAESSARAYGDGQFSELLSEFRTALDKLALMGPGREPTKIGDAVPGIYSRIENRVGTPAAGGVPTGITKLDVMIHGLHPENVIVAAGRPGMGKTAWLTTVLANAAKAGVPCLMFSLEMSEDELIERILAGESRVSNEEIRSGRAAHSDQALQLFEGSRRVGEWPFWIDDRGGLTLSQMSATARRWYSKVLGPVPAKGMLPKPAIIGIDYVQIMGDDPQPDRRQSNRAEAIGRNTSGIKQLAKALRVPIIELSQLNRGIETRGGPPTLADLRESGSIEQDADVVLFPWRVLSADPEEAAKQKHQSGPAELIIGKNRHGRCGSVPVHWHAEFTRFENATADEPMSHWQDR